MTYWINDRVPTKQDTDADGDVVVCTNRQGNLVFTFKRWDHVDLGEHWLPFIDPLTPEQSSFAAATQPSTPQPPTPCLVERRFVSLAHGDYSLWAVADDGTAWRCPHDESLPWIAVPPVPPR